MRRATLIATFGLFLSANAFGSISGIDLDPETGFDISGGFEHESHAVGGPAGTEGRIAITFRGIHSDYFVRTTGAHGALTFIPLYLVLDSKINAAELSGGGVAFSGDTKSIRKVVGALVEGSYEQGKSVLFLRGKLAQVDYDRDKGSWAWKALDAAVAAKSAWMHSNGKTTFDLEFDLGASFGGVNLRDFSDLEKALEDAPVISNAFTVNPQALVKTGLQCSDFRIELIGKAEQRFDLTAAAKQPTPHAFNSQNYQIETRVEYVFAYPKIRSDREAWSIFMNAGYEYDNLMISEAFFSNNAFSAFKLMMGLRGKF